MSTGLLIRRSFDTDYTIDAVRLTDVNNGYEFLSGQNP